MKRLLLFCAVVFAAMFSACTEDESSPVGDVYGIVSDLKSGAPVRNAEVIISPSNASTVSGSDGHFEFKSLTPGQYKISVEANGYSSNSRQVTVVAGQRISCDIHLTPEADNDVISINPTSIDFGTNELQIAATVTNESDSETEWFLDLGDTPWLYAYPTTGRIGGGKTHSIVFTANRARMNEDKSSVVNISAFGNTHPLSLKCKQSVQLSSVMVVESLNVDFGEEATEQIIRIRNVSETDVNWTLYKVQSERLSMSATHGIVAPGGSQIVTIRLDREGLDEVLATTFMISDGTVDQPVNVIAYPTPEGATTTNKIFYTSIDGNIVEPNDPSAFLDAKGNVLNIISNTYEYGRGVIVFDGEVASIGKEAYRWRHNLVSISLPYGITSIGDKAFEMSGLNYINIPNSVSTIGNSAFWDCNELTTVDLGEGVVSIGDDAFACCKFKSIDIPNSVTKIGNTAFRQCNELVEFRLPDNITEIGYGILYDCKNLKAIYGPYTAENNKIIVKDGVLLAVALNGLTSYTVPNYITSIGAYTFMYADLLTSINLPDGLVSIGRSAFRYCEFSSIDIPNSVTSIDVDAFGGCHSLTTITIPDGVTSIANYLFEYCYNLSTVILPNGVTSIGNSAFDQCEVLSSINIPENVTTIGSAAFRDCRGLKSIAFPDKVNSIGVVAFKDCSNLTRIDCLPTTPPTIETEVFNGVSADCKIYVPDDSYDAYVNAEGWSEYKDMIVNPNPTPAVQSQIFYTSTDGNIVTPKILTPSELPVFDANIVSNVYENGQGVITFDGEVTSIGSQAFYDCSNLTSINIPNSITSIGEIAFASCENLASITIPDSVTSIGATAFANCESFTSVTIPNSVTSIGRAAFASCDNLKEFKGKFASDDGLCLIVDGVLNSYTSLIGITSITIPNSVSTIGEQVFSTGKNLTSVIIPSSVTSIESWAFFGCSSLATVYCEISTPPALGSQVFDYNATGRIIYVPTASVDAYKAAENWSSYADAIVGYDF